MPSLFFAGGISLYFVLCFYSSASVICLHTGSIFSTNVSKHDCFAGTYIYGCLTPLHITVSLKMSLGNFTKLKKKKIYCLQCFLKAGHIPFVFFNIYIYILYPIAMHTRQGERGRETETDRDREWERKRDKQNILLILQ